jgi:hypothetical protein
MNRIAVARARLERVNWLPAILDAAYNAFEDMLLAIQDQQDRGGGAFAAFVMSGASAASGRDAVAAAPSLPSRASDDAACEVVSSPAAVTTEEAAAVLAGLSQLLASRLADTGALAADVGDRLACTQAARHAADICSLLGGAPGKRPAEPPSATSHARPGASWAPACPRQLRGAYRRLRGPGIFRNSPAAWIAS